jgi:hypothetical protein
VLLHDRVDVIVEAGYRSADAGTFTWDVSSWDSGASWSDFEPTWIRLDGWTVERVQTRRGRSAANRRHPAGTATVELVWTSPAGVWSFRPTSPVALGQEMRIRVQPRSLAGSSLGSPLPIYRGAIRKLADHWTPASTDHPATFRISCQLVDRMADLGAVNLPELGSPVGLDDLTGARLSRILTMAGISTKYLRGPFDASLPAGAVHHQSGTFARNLLDEAQVAVESETGDFYVDRWGLFAFRQRRGTGSYARENVAQLTWANDATVDAIAPAGEFGTGQDLDDVVNQVSMARAGGTAYVAGGPSTDSAIRYGLRTYQRFDLTCRYDADVTYCADYWLGELQGRTQRIEQISADVNPAMPDDRLVELLDIELGDKHGLSWTDYDAGAPELEGSAHVQGVEHAITATSWTVGVNLWAYADEGLKQAPRAWGTAIWGTDVWG